MMDYIELRINISPVDSGREILIALLSEIDYESFQETEVGLKAYIHKEKFNIERVKEIIDSLKETYTATCKSGEIETINWNEEWEKNYSAVLIDDRCLVRAPFHDSRKDIEYEIIIEPKMSFGTAHHATTSLMISRLLENPPTGLNVLDIGCGTGVLAILAKKMGAAHITAVDNYIWAYENSLENAERNNCRDINVIHGDSSSLTETEYDLILANINRNVLIEDIPVYANHIKMGGQLVISGFFQSDIDLLSNTAKNSGFDYVDKKLEDKWASVRFLKIT